MKLAQLINRPLLRSFSSLSSLLKSSHPHKPDPLTRVNSILSESDHFEPKLDKIAHIINPQILSSVVMNPPHLRLGFRFFIWAIKYSYLRAWELNDYVIDLILTQNDGFSIYWDTLQELHKCGISVPADAFIVLISGYFKMGNAEKAVESFGKMKDFNCKPNLYTYNAMLYVMVQKEVLVLALALYSQMLKLNCRPNVATFSILIDGLCKSGHIQDALVMFDEMSERGVPPNNVTYTSVLLGLCQAERAYDAQALLYKMTNSGHHLDSITCNGLLAGFCKLGKVDEALMLLKFFENQGYRLGIKGYSCIVDGFFRLGRFGEANEWFRKVIEANIAPDVVLYTIMIRGLCNMGRVHDAWKFIQEMTRKGVAPDTQCYNALIKGFCDAGLLEEARSLKLEISKNNCFPNTNTYTILICGMCKNGLVGEANQIFEEMEKLGCFPSVVTFNALIYGLCKAHRLEEARYMFYKMEIGRNPSVFLRLSQGADRVLDKASLQSLIARLCDSGLYLKAYRLLRKLADDGVYPDIITYNILINGMCKSRNLNAAFKLFRELQLKGPSPDSVTYGTLMSALVIADREQEAIGMLQDMVKNSCAPTPSIYRSLITWLCRKKKVSMSFSLWLDYLRRFKHRDDKALRVIEDHFKNQEVEDAVRGLLELDFKLRDFDLAPYTIWLIGLYQARRPKQAFKIFRVLQEYDVAVTPPSCVRLIQIFCYLNKLDLATNVFLYALEKGFMLKPRICNLLISSLLRREAYVEHALSILVKIDSMGYDVDAQLSHTTKRLWEHHLKKHEAEMALEDSILAK